MRRPITLSWFLVLGAAGCGSAPHPRLGAELATGPANGPPGGVLVFASECAGMQTRCPATWAPAVDAIVTSGLAFHGYTTIEPSKLRKDEGTRSETTVARDSTTTVAHDDKVGSVGVVGIIPVASYTTSKGTTVTVNQSTEKTVVLTGATLEDLALADRKQLMAQAGAQSLLTTRIIVGASWSVWSTAQSVEVMIKLSDAVDGTMRWAARCSASSGDFPSAAAAIEAAAHCAVDSITAPPG
jgi:hypothetical protein